MHDTQTLVPAQELAATNKAHYPNESADYRTARNELLVEEIELRRHLERVASQRRALPPGGEILQDFKLASYSGPIRFSSLFGICRAPLSHSAGGEAPCSRDNQFTARRRSPSCLRSS